MNEGNLIPGAHKLTVEEQSRGGNNSSKSRQHKADFRKAVQEILNNTYTDKSGMQMTGVEALSMNLFKIAMDPKSRQGIQAMRLLLELYGQDKSPEDKKKIKAEIKLLEAKVKLLSGGNEDVALEKLDRIMGQLRTELNGD